MTENQLVEIALRTNWIPLPMRVHLLRACASLLLLCGGVAPLAAQDVSPLQRLEQALGLGKTREQASDQDPEKKSQDETVQQEVLPPPLLQGPKQAGDPITDQDRAEPTNAVALPGNLENLRPYLGVRTADLTDSLSRELGVPIKTGAVLQEVVPDSPADKAGLQTGIVIVAVDGRRVDRGADLDMQVARKQPGDEILLMYYEGKKLSRARFLVGGIAEEAVGLPSRNATTPALADSTDSPTEVQRPREMANGGTSAEKPASRPQNEGRRGRLLRRLIDPDREGPVRILDRLGLGEDRSNDEEREQRDEDVVDPTREVFDATAMPEPINQDAGRELNPEEIEVRHLLDILEQQQQQIADLQRRVLELERRLAEATSDRN